MPRQYPPLKLREVLAILAWALMKKVLRVHTINTLVSFKVSNERLQSTILLMILTPFC